MTTTPNRRNIRVAEAASTLPWRITTLTLMAAAILITGILAASACQGVSASSAWIRFAPPGTTVHAGYLTLANTGPSDVSLTGASSPGYARVEIHHSKVIDGVATMEKIAQISVPSGQTVALKPGGLHLMLIKPTGAQELGTKVPVKLSFSDGSSITVQAEVNKGGKPEKMDHHKHHHGHMHHSG
ncbi:MAG: copper chaperone PCu(A)C [Filomicrobium sp.]